LKWLLNQKSGTTLKNFKRIIPELTEIIESIPCEGKSNQELLHLGLEKMGWSKKDIKKLTQKTEKQKASNRNINPSFELYKPRDASKTISKGKLYRSVQGGSPGLGKNK
jgi:hypothetical protein|tara:strand:+ start:525 stop:851 length:327 start_codon:yes stop_codon:yes gene_type:complete